MKGGKILFHVKIGILGTIWSSLPFAGNLLFSYSKAPQKEQYFDGVKSATE